MKLKYLVLVIGSVTLSACTSSTKSTINKPIVEKVQVSKTIVESQGKSLKRIVAIGRFSDETKRGNSFLIDKTNNRIGKQASDILSARLTDSGKFLMLERSDLDNLMEEKHYIKAPQEYIGADYMIMGSVSEYGRSTTSDVGIFSRNKIQKAYVTVNVRLVDTKTSQVVYSEEATGEAVSEANHVFGVGERAGYNSSLDDKALSAAISKLVSNIIENLLDSPWQAYLLSYDEGKFFLSGGKEQGIKEGDVFQVLEKGKQVKNPQTGLFIELPAKQVGTIQVVGFAGTGKTTLSIAELKSGQFDFADLTRYVVRELKD